MDRNFESHLLTLRNSLVKNKYAPKDEKVPLDTLREQSNLDHFAIERNTDAETQDKIFNIQKEKQDRITELIHRIKIIQSAYPINPEETPPNAVNKLRLENEYNQSKSNRITYSKGVYYIEGKVIHPAEILAAVVWGKSAKCNLDPNSVPRQFQLKYEHARAKSQIKKKTDKQIFLDGISKATMRAKSKNKFGLLRAYQGIEKNYNLEDTAPKGALAEAVSREFLRKCSLVLGEPFTVIDSDPCLDAEFACDYKIRIPDNTSDDVVTIDEIPKYPKNTSSEFVVQMGTFESERERSRHLTEKRKRIQEVLDDLGITDTTPAGDDPEHTNTREQLGNYVIVLLRRNILATAFERWQTNGGKPGGPDKLLDKTVKKNIFMTNLSHIIKKDGNTDQARLINWWSQIEASGIL